MIHTIIYDNRPERGYDLYDQSPDFPSQYKPDINEICRCMGQPEGNERRGPALRYGPLADRYLLSVIFYLPPQEAQQNRGHTAVVNFLMTAQDADEFFAVPFVQQVSKVIDTAQLFFAKQTLEVPVDQPITLPPAVMLSGAIYAAEKQAKQVFIGYDGSPIPEISALLQLLPYGLRKDISFRTDVRDGGESYGTAINFGSLQAISELVSKDYLNSPNTDKYTYFSGDDSELRNKNACDETANKISGQLFRAITSIEPYELFRRSIGSWDEFGSLIGVNGSNDPLKAAISMVSEDALADAIAKTEMAPDTLHRLETAAPSKYKKVIEALKAKRTPPAPAPHKAGNEADGQNRSKARRGEHPCHRRRPNPKLLNLIGDLVLAAASGLGLIWLIHWAIKVMATQQGQYLTITISLADAAGIVALLGAASLGICFGIFAVRLVQKFKK